MKTFSQKKRPKKKVMAIFVDSGISRHSLFCSGGDESYYLHMCPTTLKISGYCVYCRCRSFVRFSRSRIVRLSPRHLCTERSNTTQHNTTQSGEDIAKLVFISFLF